MSVFKTETKYTAKKQVEKINSKYHKEQAIKTNIEILEMAIDALEIAEDHIFKNVLGELKEKRKKREIGYFEYMDKRNEILASYNHLSDISEQKITECNEWKKLLKS